MIRRSPKLNLSTFLYSCLKKSGAIKQTNPYYYGYARQALEDVYRLLGLKSGDVVLYPDYICDVTLAPCHSLGLTVSYYPVGEDLQPDWEALDQFVDNKVKVVLSVNYFGFPSSPEMWRTFAENHGIWWIEDNAHGYGSRYKGRGLGSFGDLSISSMRKVLPLLNGACLNVNSPELTQKLKKDHLPLSPLKRFPGNEEMRRFMAFALRWSKLPLHKPLKSNFSKMDPSQETDHRPFGMDILSVRLLKIFQRNLDTFAEKRRSVYTAWEKFCARNGLQPVFKRLYPGVSPMVFPCYVKNFEEKRRWLSWGRANRIDIHTWPSLPQHLRDPYGLSVQKWQRLLCLPVQQDLDPPKDINWLNR